MTIVIHPRLCALAWVILALLGPVGATAAGCNPAVSCCDKPPTGAPQCPAGNPIDVTSGNKYQREQDMPALPGVLGLELVRHYNSADAQANERGILGRGWRLGYEEELLAGAGGNSLTLVLGDGARMRFFRGMLQPDAGRTVFVPDRPSLLRVHMVHTRGGIEYGLRLADGLHVFDGQGKLVRIEARTGEVLTLQRDRDGWLQRVTDPQGRSLVLHYQSGSDATGAKRYSGVASIDTPVGRFSYSYGSPEVPGSRATPTQRLANLASVGLPAAPANPATPGEPVAHPVRRLYHFEDGRHAWALTGITVRGAGTDGRAMDERIVTWGYDARGRANLSVRGRHDAGKPGIEQVDLVFNGPGADGSGETVLTNSLGQVTRYRYARIQGQTQLLEVRGAGCASCGLVNVRYAYDSRGRPSQAIRLDAQGRPWMAEITTYDGAGRVRQVSELRYDQGRPGPERMRVRYQYGDDVLDPQPVLIARPSVVAGQEHAVRITYNDKGQPTELTESGFSPLDETGAPVAAGMPIRRTTRYAYAEVNRRSVLVGMDGPLPNGPKGSPEDSDLTRLEWDDAGNFVRAVVLPLGRHGNLRLDAAGRVASVSIDDGTVLRVGHAPDGELAAIEREVGGTSVERTLFKHDALRRLTEQVQVQGGQEVSHRRQAFDLAGHLLWQADVPGTLKQARYDSEGRPLAVAAGAGRMRQEERFGYDDAGRLEQVEDGTGGVRRLVRETSGRLLAAVDPLGRWTTFEPGDHSLAIVRAANTGKPLAQVYQFNDLGQLTQAVLRGDDGMGRIREVIHSRVLDDFGREVAVQSPDAGRQVRRFDEADRLVQVALADGARVDLAYDAGGRLVRGSVQPTSGAAEDVTYAYRGTRLERVEDPQQAEVLRYDALGRLAERSVSLKLNAGGSLHSLTRYRYDEKGRLAGQTLPDGSELQFERDGLGQVVALHRHAAPWAPWGWGRTTLARGMERDLVHLASFTYGNGIEARWERSASGVLSRLVYLSPLSQPSVARSASEPWVPSAEAQATARAPASGIVPRRTLAVLPARPASIPIALDHPADPRALWDGQCLFDGAGNLLVQAQLASHRVPQPVRTLFAYDALDQLAQAVVRRTVPDGMVRIDPDEVWRYHSDSLGNRLLAQEGKPGAASTRTLAYEDASNRLPGTASDAAGRPGRSDGRELTWDGLGRLQAVTWRGATTRYRYNRDGLRVASQGAVQRHVLYDEGRHRLAELDGEGRLVRQYVWLGNQLLAVIDGRGDMPLARPGGWAARLRNAWRVAWAEWTGAVDLKYVHADHRGAPVAMTDSQARTVWQSDYAPFGQRHRSDAQQRPGLDLRGPGQWEDAESGLYYNDQRYYDPQTGRYLSPDPLGMQGGVNAFSYAGNNPVVNGDPLGLVLLAFDGTGNTSDLGWLHAHGSSRSNVWRFQQLYESGITRYVSGVGTIHSDETYGDIRPQDYAAGTFMTVLLGASPEKADMGGNYSGPARIERMMQYFNDLSDLQPDDIAMPVDIVGFSRGASEARDFANRIVGLTRDGTYRYTRLSDHKVHCQKLSFRFMGLFDTVLSTNFSGATYNLAIPDAFAYVAQAVALNEYRGGNFHSAQDSKGAFPLESIQTSAASVGNPPGTVRIERGFLGSHADIGGGFGEAENQLAQVALVWMVDQARNAGITMRDAPISLPPDPVLHDKSDSLVRGQGPPASYAEDRKVKYRDGTQTTQRKMVPLAGMSYADTLDFIHFFKRGLKAPDWEKQRELYQTGTVDVERYIQWLDCHGYHIKEEASQCASTL